MKMLITKESMQYRMGIMQIWVLNRQADKMRKCDLNSFYTLIFVQVGNKR